MYAIHVLDTLLLQQGAMVLPQHMAFSRLCLASTRGHSAAITGTAQPCVITRMWCALARIHQTSHVADCCRVSCIGVAVSNTRTLLDAREGCAGTAVHALLCAEQ